MFVAQQDPMGRIPIYDDIILNKYTNEISEHSITFEYFDNKEFEEINNSIFNTKKQESRFFDTPSTYVSIDKKKFERLLKLCAIQGIENDNITKVYYYIENCESRKFKHKILNYISTI